MKVLGLGVVALASLVGCSTAAFIAPAGDYSAYRATRTGKTLEDRLGAADRYLHDRPHGFFHDEVEAAYRPVEAAYWSKSQGSRAGLEAYLATLPRGPHQAEAESALRGLVTREKVDREEIHREVADVEARVSGPGAEERARVRRELIAWLNRFLDPETFKVPFSRARSDLVVAFTLSLPSPRCRLVDPPVGEVERECKKLLDLSYPVLVKEAPEPRSALLEITILEDARGVPLEVTLAGPDFFLRLEETFRIAPLGPDERPAALARGVKLVEEAFARGVSADPSCRQRLGPAEALHRSCNGRSVVVRPAGAPGEDDRIVISPEH